MEKVSTPKKRKSRDSFPETLREIRRLAASLLVRLPRVLEMRVSVISITVASEDPSRTAILYGAVSQSLAFFLEWIDGRLVRIRKKRKSEISVTADFLSDRPTCDVRLVFAVRISALLRLAITVLLPFFLRRTAKKKKKHKSSSEKRNAECQTTATSSAS